MRAGEFIRSFVARNGQSVTLRAPSWSDLDDMLKFINGLVEEDADVLVDTKKTREEEVDWLAGRLSQLEKDQIVQIEAEVDGHMVGQVQVPPGAARRSHVGTLGISVKKEYRDIGIGQELMLEAERQAKRLGVEILTLSVFASNERARHVYEKVGYRECGRIPRDIKKGDEYIDSVIMVKEIA